METRLSREANDLIASRTVMPTELEWLKTVRAVDPQTQIDTLRNVGYASESLKGYGHVFNKTGRDVLSPPKAVHFPVDTRAAAPEVLAFLPSTKPVEAIDRFFRYPDHQVVYPHQYEGVSARMQGRDDTFVFR